MMRSNELAPRTGHLLGEVVGVVRALVRFGLGFRLIVVPAALLLMVLGLSQLRTMPVEALPEFTPPHVEVQTEALGLSAQEVEELITIPLEADLLNGVAWLDEIRSESVPGLSSIELVFEPGTDLMKARQVVQERLTQAHALPNVSMPPVMIQPLSSTSRVLMVGLSSAELSLIDLSVLARWKLKPKLMGVPGVANVAIWGQREQQLQVQLDPDRLRENGVSVVQVMETTANALWVSPLSFVEASTPGTGGFIDTPNQRLGVQHISPIIGADNLSQVTVEDTEGRVLRLADVAEVVEDHQPLIGDAIVDGAPSLILVVEKFPGASTQEVTAGVEDALATMAPGLAGVTMDSSLYRPADFIRTATDTLSRGLLVGLLLVVVALLLLLLDWRAAVISVVALVLSLFVATYVLYLRGTTFNSMVLAGLVMALGVVVHDAVADAHALARRSRSDEAPDDGPDADADAVLAAALTTRAPASAATVVALLVALPLLTLGGVTGAFSRPLALTYGLALVTSTLVALVVTPGLALLLGRPSASSREPALQRVLRRGYDRLLPRVTGRRAPLLATAGVLAVAGVLAGSSLMGSSLTPTFTDRDLVVRWNAAAGTSHPEMMRLTARAVAELRTLDGVRDVGAHVGRALTSDQVVGMNSSEIWVNLQADAPYRRTVDAVREVVEGYPGVEREVITYPEQQVRRVRTGTDDDVVVRVYGYDQEVLEKQAGAVLASVRAIDGVVDPTVQLPTREPMIEVEVRLDDAQRAGIKPGDVRRAAATLLSGVMVGNLFEDQKVFDVVVWGDPATRHSLSSIQDLMIDLPDDSGQVRLGDVADVRVTANPSTIRRDAVSRYVDVTAAVADRDLGAVLDDVTSAIQRVDFPIEYHAEVLSGSAERGFAVPWAVALAVAVGVLLVLQVAFDDWRLAFVVVAGLPLALVGGAVAALLDGDDLALATVVGLGVVFGLAVRQAVVLVRHYQALGAENPGTAPRDVVLAGTRDQLVPIVATTLVTALLLLPFAVMGARAGTEIVAAAALVGLGGLVTSTLVVLLLLPAAYAWVGRVAPDPQSAAIPTSPVAG